MQEHQQQRKSEIHSYVTDSGDKFIEEFRIFLKQPSVSAQNRGVADCAKLLRDMMTNVGIETKIVPTKGHPIVYGEIRSKDKGAKTLLVYDHYDVQPPEPVEKWLCDPFEAKVDGNRIYARGSSDSKGNVFAYIKAVEALKKTTGDVPINFKFIWEGEEEIGSEHLAPFLEDNREMLASDDVHMCDGRPWELCYGSKGLLYVELRVKGSDHDQHSGKAGPIVANPAWQLVWLLNSLKGPDGRVKLDGFYDDILPLTKEEIEALKSIPFNETELKEDLGLKDLPTGKTPEDLFRAQLLEPTFNIAGFNSGYTGPGSKTVLPGEAMCKIDMRLVANQNPDVLYKNLLSYLKRGGMDYVQVKRYWGGAPYKTPLDASIGRVISEAHKEVYGQPPAIIPSSWGSIPFYVWAKILNLRPVMIGISTGYVNAHAPNEWNTIDGVLTGIEFFAMIANKYAHSS